MQVVLRWNDQQFNDWLRGWSSQFSLQDLLFVFVPVALVCLALRAYLAQPGPPKTVVVYGTVTLNGSPIQGATVVFYPLDQNGLSATGSTDATGRFQLESYYPSGRNLYERFLPGLLPGKYAVGVVGTGNQIPERFSHGIGSIYDVTRGAPVDVTIALPTE